MDSDSLDCLSDLNQKSSWKHLSDQSHKNEFRVLHFAVAKHCFFRYLYRLVQIPEAAKRTFRNNLVFFSNVFIERN